jgi:thiamine transport system substrate-binding protein
VTSEAFHRMKGREGERGRYRAVVFEDGNPVQIEGAAILAGAPGGAEMRKRALAFLELLVSDEIQRRIPETQWMMPVRTGTALPEAFRALPTAKKRFPADLPREKLVGLLERWGRAIRRP